MCNGRKQHESRRAVTRIVPGERAVDPCRERLAKVIRIVIERLVIAEHRKDDIGPGEAEIIPGSRKTVASRSIVYSVARKTVVANHEFVIGKFSLQIRFQPTIVLHSVSQGIADDDDVFTFFELDCGRFTPCEDYEKDCTDSDSEHFLCFHFDGIIGLRW